MKKKFEEEFFNLYTLQKTLRFELKPVGETAEYIENFKSEGLKQFVSQDEQRALDYQKTKQIIDDYHRDFIEESLAYFSKQVSDDHVKVAFGHYEKLRKATGDDKASALKDWESHQTNLRKKVVKCFSVSNKTRFSRIDKKKLIKQDLIEWLTNQNRLEDIPTVESFSKFTTYFKGFQENRKNIYSVESHATAISFRIVHENMPKFFDNVISYLKLREVFPELIFDKVIEDLELDRTLDQVFEIANFSEYVTQEGIDHFNYILGGKTLEDGTKKQGVNEQINLFKQQQTKEIARKIPKMVSLFKQILSERTDSHSFIPPQFENDQELFNSLRKLQKTCEPELEKLQQAILALAESDLEKVYIKAADINELSNAVYGFRGVISESLQAYKDTLLKKKDKEAFEKKPVFSLAELVQYIKKHNQTLDENKQNSSTKIIEYLTCTDTLDDIFQTAVSEKFQNASQLFKLNTLSSKRKPPKDEDENGEEGFEQVKLIKNYLDSLLDAVHFAKPLYLVKGRKPIDGLDKDQSFYEAFETCYRELESYIVPVYNKTRSYLSRKSYKADKFKINFDNNTLLSGWDVNKETDNASVIFRKDGLYYLGFMPKGNTFLFDYIDSDEDSKKEVLRKQQTAKLALANNSEDCYEKVRYKLLPCASQMLPKVFFSKKRIGFFAPSDEILRIRNTASHTKNGTPQKGYAKAEFNLSDCHKMIDFFKASIPKYPSWKGFDFEFSPTENYEDTSAFYREVENQGYQISFDKIKQSYIDEQISKGNLYLFQIYNKDFSPFSKGRPNLHTLYWKALFEEANLKNVVAKLNGEAEIFFRRHSIKKSDRVVHPANRPVDNKNPHTQKKQSTFEYDLVKDKRYTKDKFFFHVPISLNFKATGVTKFNDKVNTFLQQNPKVNIIGIDRGERHLLYFTVINQKGEILVQETLNTLMSDMGHKNDYQQKLDKKENERDAARKSWASVENIKELKEGYLSHVVHKLAQLIIEHNAIVCLEDLNFDFKRGRFKVEKQVYQKFERALIEKLNYLVFKDKELGEVGHYLTAYQLTAPFKSFKDLGKQSGILYYVRADYTSKIDPTTGFVNFLNLKYQSIEKSKQLLSDFTAIRYNAEQDYFEFDIDYKKIKITAKREVGEQTQWTLCTFGNERYQNYRDKKSGQWHTETVNVTQELKKLFESCDTPPIDYANDENLIEAILQQEKKEFYSKLFWLIKLTMTLRHSKFKSDDDFILSPVKNSSGEFYDSRKVDGSLPKDADANGAYNIALKGLWNLQRINEWKGGKLNLKISNKDWFNFVQQKPYR
jgi:CRISPR-associated protein Cpf1